MIVEKSKVPPTWCPGCGDYAVLKAVESSLANLKRDPKDVVIVSGIGCSSNLPHFLNTYGIHGIHGRAIPIATGVRLANHDLTVLVTGGDGDGYGIGLGHFLHAARRNINLTYIVMNNQIYGLTTGQVSPTSEKYTKTKSTPTGSIEEPVNPIALALMSGATYVSRGFSGEINHLATLVENAIRHNGFSLVDVLSPCVSFNKLNTYSFFRERVYTLEGENHDAGSMERALAKSMEWGTRIPIGLFYETQKKTYEEEEPALESGPLAKQSLIFDRQLVEEFIARCWFSEE